MNSLRIIATSIKNQVRHANGGAEAGNDALMGSVKNIINGVMIIIGVVAVIMVIVGGVNYATSQGDPSKITKAKKTIIAGIAGLIIVMLAFAIVNFVVVEALGG